MVIVVVGLLVVNYFRNLDTSETFPTGTQTEEKAQTDTYKVAKGDTLWSISEKVYGSGYNWVDIRDANNIQNPNDLEEGTELTIPDVEVRGVNNQLAGGTATAISTATPTPTASPKPTITASPTATPTATPAATQIAKTEDQEEKVSTPEKGIEANAGGTYIVQRGDNLWNIAVAAYGDGYRWVDIAKANNLVNPSIIHAGNVLTIPS